MHGALSGGAAGRTAGGTLALAAALGLVASWAVGAPGERAGRSPAAAARAPGGAELDPFAYEPAPFSFQRRRERRLPGVTVYRVEMPSPVVSGDPHNDTIYGFDHVPWLGAEAAAIVLPIAAGRDLVLERSFATWLALRGIRAFVMPLPYQHERGAGARRDVLRREGGLEDLLAFFRQAVLDTERVRQWLVQAQGVPAGRVGLVGISLGSLVAALAYGHDPGFGAAALLLGGGDLAEVIWHGSRETRRLKERLLEAGHDLASVRAALRPVDPLSWARPERGRGLLMLNATRDEVFPRRSTERLLAAWGPEARIVWFPGDHYSVALFLPVALEQVASHLRAQLLERR